jgi:hypothetical protein
MTYKKTISSVEYQESVTRAMQNSKNHVSVGRKTSSYVMIDGIPHKFKDGNLIPLTKLSK